MKIMKTHHRQDNFNPALDAAGERLGHILLSSIDDIDASTLQRLRATREQAVEHHRLALVHAAQAGMSVAGHRTAVPANDYETDTSRWQRLANIGMLIALLLGLWMIDTIQSENSMQDAIEIDSALLADDLPPAAYLDPGFKHFLKLSYPAEPL